MLGFFPAGSVFLFAAACSTSSTGGSPPSCPSPGGAVQGPPDTHCTADGGPIVQPTRDASCSLQAGTGDAGTSGADGGPTSLYGPTRDNAESDDDDCKYHVRWTATPICENNGVTFTVVATNKTDGSPLTGAGTLAEVYLNDSHPAPNSHQTTSEGPPGTYTVGPVLFDAPGKWTVRFHFRIECADLLPDSPHGHAAFYVEVP